MLQVRVSYYFKQMLMFPCGGALPEFHIKTSTPLPDVNIYVYVVIGSPVELHG